MQLLLLNGRLELAVASTGATVQVRLSIESLLIEEVVLLITRLRLKVTEISLLGRSAVLHGLLLELILLVVVLSLLIKSLVEHLTLRLEIRSIGGSLWL